MPAMLSSYLSGVFDSAHNLRSEFNGDAYDRRLQAEAAQIDRDWQADQAEKAMQFEANQNRINRDFQAASAAEAMRFEADQAQINRDWQAQMSNTAYQRAVADLRAAGLNPALAYQQGGAATTTGATASGHVASGSSASSSMGSGSKAEVVTGTRYKAMQIYSGIVNNALSSAASLFSKAIG